MGFAQKRGMSDFVKEFEDEVGILFFDGGWLLYETKDKQHTIFWFDKNILRGSCYTVKLFSKYVLIGITVES